MVSTSVGGISAEIREILTVQRPVTPQRAGASGSKINDDSVSTFKQACSGQYSGSLKLSSQRFECAHNRSAPLLTLFSIAPEVNSLGRYRAVIRVKFVFTRIYLQERVNEGRGQRLGGVAKNFARVWLSTYLPQILDTHPCRERACVLGCSYSLLGTSRY